MKKHSHYWKNQYSTGNVKNMVVTMKCRCGQTKQRPGTRQEREELQNMFDPGIHKLWHAFLKKFATNEMLPIWQWSGYEMSKRVERWARNKPEIKIVRCDDSYYSNSDLILIPHATEKEYHGTSVVYVPQCTGEKPTVFFLYPSHHESLRRALAEIKHEHKHKEGWY